MFVISKFFHCCFYLQALPKIVWEAKCYHSEVEYHNTSDGQ